MKFEKFKKLILKKLGNAIIYHEEGKHIAKFKEMSNLALDFFRKFKGFTIDIDIPSQYSETSGVRVEVPEFEITEENKEQYQKIVALSEHTCCLSHTLNTFRMSFLIFNVWKEETE